MSYSQLPDNGWTTVATNGSCTANAFAQLGLLGGETGNSAGVVSYLSVDWGPACGNDLILTFLLPPIWQFDPSRAPEFATYDPGRNLDGYVVGTAGDDTVAANTGNDWYQLGTGADTLSFASGVGHDIVDVVPGGGGSLNLSTGIATDALWGYRTGDVYAVADLNGGDNLTVLGLSASTLGTLTSGAGTGSPDVVTAATDANADGLADFGEMVSVLYGSSGLDNITAGNGLNAVIWGGAGGDTLTGGTQRSVLFGGGDGDSLTTKSAQYSTLVGGTGGDSYLLDPGTSAEIYDLGSSAGDVVNATSISLNSPTTWIYTVDGRHLGIFDTTSQTYLLIYDWQTAENRIETFNFGDGTYTYDAIAAAYATAPNYLGDFTWEQLGGSTASADAWLANLRTLAGDDNGPTMNLTIGGTTGADALTGFSGDNTLVGGKGNDTLTGGAGNDTYVFRPGDGQDKVDNVTGAQAGEYNSLRFGGGILAGQLFTDPTMPDLTLHYSANGSDSVTLTAWSLTDDAYRARILTIQTSDSPELWLTTRDESNFAFSEMMVGTAGNDTMNTGAGDDWIVGAGGNDAIDGGSGNDTVAYAGNRASYSIVRNAGIVTVTDLDGAANGGDSGADTLKNVEHLQFSDGSVSLTVSPNDFNGDGSSDLFWSNINGALAQWQLNGTSYVGGGVFSGPTSDWSIAAAADFNGDGANDILWRNANGALAEWFMNGARVVGGGAMSGPGAGWTLAATADFNGDGMADLLWQHSSGALCEWQMNGTAVTGGGVISGPGAGWTLAMAADFTGDGRADILWRNANGALAEWQMNGTSVGGGGAIAGPGGGWALRGAADFSGDGKADLLWQNGGSLAEWYMDGTAVSGGGVFGGAGGSWSLAGLSDFNGDGRADILWSDSGGGLAQWQMNGTTVTGGGSLGARPAGWNLVNSGQLIG